MEWRDFIKDESSKLYFKELQKYIAAEREKYTIYPPAELVFNAFAQTPFDSVKVVLVGQDPYHGPRQAMGLSFSVPFGMPIPPSLKNIQKEIEDDLGILTVKSGDLTRWARQGVLLLNTTLTVRSGEPNSHKGHGWGMFTSNAIERLNQDDKPKVFMLFGKDAQSLERLMYNPNHLVIRAAHPSPLSAYKGFFGCKAFSKANQFLVENGREPIDWR